MLHELFGYTVHRQKICDKLGTKKKREHKTDMGGEKLV